MMIFLKSLSSLSATTTMAALLLFLVALVPGSVQGTSYQYVYFKRDCDGCNCGSWRATDYRWCVETGSGNPAKQYGPTTCWDEDAIVRIDTTEHHWQCPYRTE